MKEHAGTSPSDQRSLPNQIQPTKNIQVIKGIEKEIKTNTLVNGLITVQLWINCITVHDLLLRVFRQQ